MLEDFLYHDWFVKDECEMIFATDGRGGYYLYPPQYKQPGHYIIARSGLGLKRTNCNGYAVMWHGQAYDVCAVTMGKLDWREVAAYNGLVEQHPLPMG